MLWFATFNEKSVTLGADNDIYVLALTEEAARSRIQDLFHEVDVANLDWVGSVKVEPKKIYFKLNRERFFWIINSLNNAVVLFPAIQNQHISTFDSPRKSWTHGH